MTAVLTAFRANEEKVAAAVAECRRMGIEVLPPDVHQSHLEFTVEGDAIRFGLLAVKNVGQGAIESIIAARAEGGPFRSLTDFCTRIDLRLANRKVLEALIKVGALRAFGHPAQVLLGLDDAIGSAQATQRDRITGQTSLFDLGAAEAELFERPLPSAAEVPVRERLRWEKELLGLYLSEHPMGEVAEQVGRYVNAYSGDLKDEALDGQRVVIGGIVTGIRSVITKRQEAMAIATLEDLQGSIEVVVFPRLYETSRPTWRDGAILLVAGRVDHKGEEVSLLADLVADWDDAAARGPEAFARDVAAGDRSGGRNGGSRRPPVAVGPGVGPGETALAPVGGGVSPRRVESNGQGNGAPPDAMPRIQPGEPITAYMEPVGAEVAGGDTSHDLHEEPSVPDEARARIVADATADAPVEAGPEAILHVRFERAAAPDRLVSAMEAVKALLRDRPGGTRVVIHVPAPGGAALPMELRWGVAYDAELLAEVRRRLGDELVVLRLAAP
jgi:DNA polymerase-3 subunit alpha